MFQQRGRIHTLINAQTVYCHGKEQYWSTQPQYEQRSISKTQKNRKLLKIERPINRRKLPATVTVTAKLKESARICGAATRGINFNKFKHKMANTLSVMTNVLRNVVSKQRIRYKENGYNLDLAYICDNIIAMGYPADNIESIFRNRLEDVYKFLQEIHQNHYKIYNLCLERSYDRNKFHGRVAVYPFEDHNPPTIELIQRFCMDVDEWLKADNQNVAAVHCKAGKGRTGTMICCYLLYSGQQKTAEDALECYAEKRTKDRKGVTIPSQRRYVQYFAKLIRSGIPYEKRILQFCEIRFTEANLLHSHGTVHCSISLLEDHGSTVTLLGLPIDFRKSYTLDLKNHALCVAGDIKVELTHKKKLFHFWFNTYFVRDAAVVEEEGDEAKLVYTLNKCEIDDAHKDKEHKCFAEGFKVQLVFYTENSMRPGMQANVSCIASQITNNQRKSQNQRISHQGSSGGGDSSSSSNCQLPQNSSSSSDLNYICDQKSSSSASASVSSFCGALVGGGGSIGRASVGDAPTNSDYLCINRNHDGGAQFMQLQKPQQLQQNKGMPMSNVQQHIASNKSNVGCDGYEYNSGNTVYRRINTASIATYTSTPQQHVPPHTYVNLAHIMAETGNQHTHQVHQQQNHQKPQQQQLTKSSATSAADHTISATPALAPNTFMSMATLQQLQQQQNNAKCITASDTAGGFSSNKNMQTAFQRVSNKLSKDNSSSNSRKEECGTPITTTTTTTTTTKRSNGETNGCISANSSKSSISSQSSTNSARTTTSSASSAAISTGEHDCEEEDWESGECQPNSMQNTVAQKAQLQTPTTLLSPSKPPTMAKSTSSDNLLPTTKTSITTINTSNSHVTKTISQNPVSKLSSNFYINTINSNSGSYIRSYCCCDDDENDPNIKCECEHVQEMEKLQKNANSEQRSSCVAVAKPNRGVCYVFRSLEDEVENRSGIGWVAVETLKTTSKNEFVATDEVAKSKSITSTTQNPFNRNTSQQTTTVCTTCDSATYQKSISSKHDKPIIQVSMAQTKKEYANPETNKSKINNMSNVDNDVSAVGERLPHATKPLFQQKFCAKKFKDYIGIPSQQSTAIDVIKTNVYDGLAGASTTIGADAAVLALSCSPASGCGGLTSTSRRKLKNKFKNNTKKLTLWLQSHFRANPVEFCENFAQHTTTSMRRNSNCSVGSRSRKLSISSLTGTPTSSLPKRQLLALAAPPTPAIKHVCDANNVNVEGETYEICYASEENLRSKHDGSFEVVCIGADPAAADVNATADNVDGIVDEVERTQITASNFSLSTVSVDVGVEQHGHDDANLSGSCDTFEDFYSSNCDNQLSFNNSPSKSPRSLVGIGDASAYSSNSPDHLLYATSLNERNLHLQIKRGELNSMQLRKFAAGQSTAVSALGKQEQQKELQQLNVVVVAAKPAKTHAIGFNVTTNDRAQMIEPSGRNLIATTTTTTTTSTKEETCDESLNKEVFECSRASERNTMSEGITITSTATLTMGIEDKEILEQQKRIFKYKFNSSSDMLDTKIDEVDEDCVDDDDSDYDDDGVDEIGTATSSSVYFTPASTGMDHMHADAMFDGTKMHTQKKPFIFPKMQCELVKMSNSSDNDNGGGGTHIVVCKSCNSNHSANNVDLATQISNDADNNMNAYEQHQSGVVNELNPAGLNSVVTQHATAQDHHHLSTS
ncbi:serine-rich adhesin for platelets [Eurosta solidaginis]|uniref:serine-rich adhesin for platelets n=1 Tax=Eurosta solidaginis TaxID=178769 RepID=UPI003530BD93